MKLIHAESVDEEDCGSGECVLAMPPSFRCEPQRKYQDCRNECVDVCVNGTVNARCATNCESGCFCFNGLVEAPDGSCISLEDCALLTSSIAEPAEASGHKPEFLDIYGFERIETEDVYTDDDIEILSKRMRECRLTSARACFFSFCSALLPFLGSACNDLPSNRRRFQD